MIYDKFNVRLLFSVKAWVEILSELDFLVCSYVL